MIELVLSIVLATIALCALILFEPKSWYLKMHNLRQDAFKAELTRRALKAAGE